MVYDEWYFNNMKIECLDTVKLCFDDSLLIMSVWKASMLYGDRVVEGFSDEVVVMRGNSQDEKSETASRGLRDNRMGRRNFTPKRKNRARFNRGLVSRVCRALFR